MRYLRSFSALLFMPFHVAVSFVLVVVSVTGRPLGAQTQPLFPVSPSTSTSADAFLQFAGDLNGDGIADLAYVQSSNTAFSLGIELNLGSSAPTVLTTQLCPASSNLPSVGFADVNNDKKPDLVYWCNGYLTIQIANGDGTFQAPDYNAVGYGQPVFADFNGDGFLDIALLVAQANGPAQITVFQNRAAAGPGTFASPVSYSAANSIGLQAGDFNGDGKADLLTTVYSPSSVSPWQHASSVAVYSGNGDGTLAAPKSQTTAAFSSFTTGDFNGDGITDIALLPVSDGSSLYVSLQIMLGNANGTFAAGSSAPMLATNATSASGGTAMATARLTSSGDVDLVVSTSVITVFRGDGKGNFLPVGNYGLGISPVLFADASGDGKPDMIVGSLSSIFTYAGNGDGTFQAPPATPVYGPFADVNNDGIADIVFYPQSSPLAAGIALGRGDGTFNIFSQTLPLSATSGYWLMTGDTNGDGKIDVMVVESGTQSPSSFACDDQTNSQVVTFLGNGDGTFQQRPLSAPLGVRDPTIGVPGDFNADGKLDLVLPYNTFCQMQLLFLPGNGDGTFGTPVLLDSTQSLNNPTLLSGDLNNDGKPDLIWGNAVFLGNGDGTFKQIPLSIQSSTAVSLADLNGDGILDVVFKPGVVAYAGKGDGTFQTSPFINFTNPNQSFFAAGRVSGSGHVDLLPVGPPFAGFFTTVPFADVNELIPYLGDGKGNFTEDENSYLVAMPQVSPIAAAAVRLNNQAPPAATDNTQDLLVSVSNGENLLYTISLINQLNPAPAKPAIFASSISVQTSSSSAAPGATVTLTATVAGTYPTGSVVFSASGVVLGTEELVNGAAVLNTSFAVAGTYNVTAAYSGDSSNRPSTSAQIPVVVASPDFTVTAASSAASIPAGKNAAFAFTVTSMAGYAGTVTFSCGPMPSLATCSFSPASVSPGAGATATSTLTISTTAATTAGGLHTTDWLSTGGLALAGAVGFWLIPLGGRKRWFLPSVLGAILLLVSLGLGGCGGAGQASTTSSTSTTTTPSQPGTPAGSYMVTVNASGGAGGPLHAITLQLTVQ